MDKKGSTVSFLRLASYGKVRITSDRPEMALIHIFRFEGDRIIE
jgi:hypothetical protein